MSIADVDALQALLVVGSNLRHEIPLLASRVRKAALRGAQVYFVNPAHYEYLFPVAGYAAVDSAGLADELAGLVAAATGQGDATDAQRAWVEAFRAKERRAVWLGALAIHHPHYARLRSLASQLATALGASLGVLADGANAAGAWLAGAVPTGEGARHAGALLSSRSGGLVLLGTEPWDDAAGGHARQALRDAGFVVALTPFASNEMRDVATVMLPIGTFAETSGTYVNLAGTWQSFAGAATPVGEARPGWKVLRVLGNLLGLAGFEQQTSEDVREEMKTAAAPSALAAGGSEARSTVNESRSLETPIYQADPLVRRAGALQRTRVARASRGLA